jgi:1,4-dihydroxy-2-naphthoate octaprenyltransferase
MTHYANDFFDLSADRANSTPTKWSGGSRVLVSGELSPRTAWNATLVLGGLALALDAWILRAFRPAMGTPLLLLVVFFLAYEYSAPPLRLHSHALGPPTAGLAVGALTPLIGFGMQGGAWSREPFLAIVPTALAQFAMILVLDLPDAIGDGKAGKRTLVVCMGSARAANLCVAIIGATYASVPFLAWAGLPRSVAFALALTAPLGAWLALTLLAGEWRRGGGFARLAWRGVLWFAILSMAEVGGALGAAARGAQHPT